MSDNTKQILAITLGSLGLVIGVFATIVAYNAKNASSSNAEVTKLVEQRFTEAQAKQDELEKNQVSQAEKLVQSLDQGEKSLVNKINSNAKQITTLQNQVDRQQNQINSLQSDNKQQANQISSLQNQVQSNFNKLNSRIDKTNQRINNSGG